MIFDMRIVAHVAAASPVTINVAKDPQDAHSACELCFHLVRHKLEHSSLGGQDMQIILKTI